MPHWLLKAADAFARIFGFELVMARALVETGDENGFLTYEPGPIRYSFARIERW